MRGWEEESGPATKQCETDILNLVGTYLLAASLGEKTEGPPRASNGN